MRLYKNNTSNLNHLSTLNLRTMKKLILSTLICLISIFAFAQVHVVAPNGNTGIGTQIPGEKLEVNGNTKTQGLILEKQNGSASASCERIGSSAFAFGAGIQGGFTVDQNYHLEFRSNTRANVLDRKISTGNLLLRLEKLTGHAGFGVGNPVTSIHTNGSITYNGSLFNASDRRLKHNISDMEYGLNEVLQLNPITFQYNGKGGIQNVSKKHIGLTAQNLQKVVPEMVTSFTYEEENEESKLMNSEDYLMIEESAIKYLLINAMKEQQAIIVDQSEKIEQQASELELQAKQLSNLETELAEIRALLTGKHTSSNVTQIDGTKLDKAQLGQNTPNPFNETTVIEYYLPKSSNNAIIAVYNSTGKLINEINIEATGKGAIDLKLTNLPKGIYHYSLIVDGEVQDTKKMLLN